jgi:hypothetical protein
MFGLALWNKALFLWAFSGILIAAMVVFPRRIVSALTKRHAAIALASFLLGAFPFILFNMRRSAATFGENVRLDVVSLPAKWIQVENAANGNALFGFIAEEDYADPPKALVSATGRIAFWIQEHLGRHRSTGFLYVFGICLALVPMWRHSRLAWFSLIFLAAAGAMMLLTKDAGGAAHHIILLWPLPITFVAIALTSIPVRWFSAVTGTAVVIANLLVANQYVSQFERNGAAGNFTDALFSLSRSLNTYRSETIYVTDWGITNSVQLPYRGQLPLRFASDPLMTDAPSALQQTQIQAMLSDPQAVFVGHVAAREAFTGVGSRLLRFANSHGYQKELLETIRDSNGRPVFEILQFHRS